MGTAVDQLIVPLVTVDGRTLAEIKVAAPAAGGMQPALYLLDLAEVREWQEYPIQLLEGVSYDFEFVPPVPGAKLRGGAVRRSPLSSPLLERGRIDPGAHTGVLDLVLEDHIGAPLARAFVEVRSAKLGYRTQYRRMLADIAERAVELLADLRAPAGVRMKPDYELSSSSLTQRFFFVKHLLSSSNFRGAIAQIVERPHETTIAEQVDVRADRGLRGGSGLARQLAGAATRVPVPATHPLARRGVTSLPRRFETNRPEPSRDTAENRFIRFALRDFADFLTRIHSLLSRRDRERSAAVLVDCRTLQNYVEEILSGPVFRDISDRDQILPLGSPVLQRRADYREVLRAWIQFNLAAQLSWDGADDVFLAGKRDVAQLYEFWVFFRILEVCERQFELRGEALANLFKFGEDGFAFVLKSGRALDLTGLWKREGRALQMRLSYNRTFKRRPNPPGDAERSFPNAGSWTQPMRPDYTISFWPTSLTEAQAEAADRMSHLHFDAKYRIEALAELFGAGEIDEAEPGLAAVLGSAKRSDLLKMHAYRDAIRRSVSAFVLYPGSETRKWRSETEILPGLGAIALAPGDNTGVRDLELFFSEAADYAYARLNA